MTRRAYIEAEIAKATKRRNRMKPGLRRDRMSRFIGSLVFACLQAQDDETS